MVTDRQIFAAEMHLSVNKPARRPCSACLDFYCFLLTAQAFIKQDYQFM